MKCVRGGLLVAMSCALLGCVATPRRDVGAAVPVAPAPAPAPRQVLAEDWTVEQVVAATRVRSTEFDAFEMFTSPEIKSVLQEGAGLFPARTNATTTFSISRHKQTREQGRSVSVTLEYDGRWRFYRTASLPGGAILTPVVQKRDVLSCSRFGCSYVELLVFQFSAQSLKQLDGKALVLRLNADSGPPVVVTVPPNFMQGVSLAIPAL